MKNKNNSLSVPNLSVSTGTTPLASPSQNLGQHPYGVSRDVLAGIPKADLPVSNTNETLGAPRLLQFFTNPRILRQVGGERIARFLQDFSSEFEAIGVDLPAPSPSNLESQPCYDEYLAAIASLLSCPDQLPPILIEALQLIENAAAPENYHPYLRPSMLRFAPDEEFNGLCTLAPALTLWFCAPTALSSFPDVSTKIVPAVPTAEPKIPHSAATVTEVPCAPAQNLTAPGECPVPQDSQNEKSEESSSACNQNSQTQNQKSNPDQPSEVSDQNQNSKIAVQKSDPDQPSDSPNLNSKIKIQKSDDPFLDRLAKLSPIAYDRARDEAAASLSIRKDTLDAEVDKRRTELNDHRQAAAVVIPCLEPWPEPVDGPEVLAQVSERFSLHCFLPPGAANAFTLWTATTHAFTAFGQSPRLNLSSPEPGCGKTTALDVIASMAARAVRTENLTAPVLFRIVDQHQPTLLLDEVDTYISQSEELRGLLNAGHKRGACAYRCEGNTVRAFRAFAPAALAGIGTLPGTLHDRSIVIPLVKALPGEIALPFDEQHSQIENVLGRKLARWARDNFAALQACNPILPATAFNRLADNWRPLFAIAQVAGGDWPQRALDAFNKLTAKADPNAQGLALLADIRQIFIQSGQARIFSTDLIHSLRALSDRPWQSSLQSANSPSHWLARQLRCLGMDPRNIRLDGRQGKGYDLADFSEAFARLAEDSDMPGNVEPA